MEDIDIMDLKQKRIYRKEWYYKHHEREKERLRKYHELHKDKINENIRKEHQEFKKNIIELIIQEERIKNG